MVPLAGREARRAQLTDGRGRMHPAHVFAQLSAVAPEDAVIAVDVGNNAYSFGRYSRRVGASAFSCRAISAPSGSRFPAAMGAWSATKGGGRKVVSVSGTVASGSTLPR